MFRCQFSKELSKEAEWSLVWLTEVDKYGHAFRTKLVKKVVTPAETPIRVVIAERPATYYNDRGQVCGSGTEIVKTLLIRAKHLEAVKEKYGAVVRQI
jgi:hypothetical protein